MHFIRHGQSELNAHMDSHGRDPGIHDPSLTTKGKAQVHAAAAQLAGQGITHILSSPYTRALQTAEIIADVLKVTIQLEPLVAEKQFYSCDVGTPVSSLKPRWPKLDFGALAHEHWWLPPDLLREIEAKDTVALHRQRETPAHFQQRVHAFREKWDTHEHRAGLLIVSHWYFIQSVTGQGLTNGEVVMVAADR